MNCFGIPVLAASCPPRLGGWAGQCRRFGSLPAPSPGSQGRGAQYVMVSWFACRSLPSGHLGGCTPTSSRYIGRQDVPASPGSVGEAPRFRHMLGTEGGCPYGFAPPQYSNDHVALVSVVPDLRFAYSQLPTDVGRRRATGCDEAAPAGHACRRSARVHRLTFPPDAWHAENRAEKMGSRPRRPRHGQHLRPRRLRKRDQSASLEWG